jgi:hypothetical protein
MIKGFKKLAALFCLFTGLLLGSCDDNLTKVGSTIQPPEDIITVYTDTFMIKASTVRLDSIFAKTSDCLIGEMYDPVYGNFKSDILCQFYCEEGFTFAFTPNNGKIDSMDLVIIYPFQSNSAKLYAYGDTTTPMQLTVYPVNQPIKRNFYSNDNPELYCDMGNPLGVKSYSVFDTSVPDSVYYETQSNDGYSSYYVYQPNIRVKLPTELGQRFYDETINNPSTFASQNAFNEFFPGVYITNTFGSGCVFKTSGSNIALKINYNYTLKSSEGLDSVAYASQWFFVSKEVVQLNRFVNNNLDKMLEENPSHTYVKAPAGVCTKLVIPTTDISGKLDVNDRYINNFNLTLRYLPEDERDFIYSPPSHLLLLPADSVIPFFEEGRMEDGVTSFISYWHGLGMDGYTNWLSSNSSPLGYHPDDRTYSFGNISSLLKDHMVKSPDKDLTLLAIPVYREYVSQNSSFYTTAISNTFDLTGVKIRKDEDFMKVVVVSSKFEDKK